MDNLSRVLVTGGAGYIGSCTASSLVKAGYSVVVVDNFSTGSRAAIPPECRVVEGDIGDPTLIARILREEKIEAVLHFAAKTSVAESVDRPIYFYQENLKKSLDFVEAVFEEKVRYFVFSSSAAVYGSHTPPPVSEEAIAQPISPYARTKLFFEEILRDLSIAHSEFKYIALRYFNVAGADPKLERGQTDPNANHLIKVAAETALGLRPKVQVFGTDYPTEDGTGVRDYIHVEDLARAHVAALEYLARGGSSQVLNCGYGRGHSVREVLEEMQRVSRTKIRMEEAPRRQGDIGALYCDNSKVKKLLGWRPQYDSLATICETALQWISRQNRKLHSEP